MIKKANIPYRYKDKNFANYKVKPENEKVYRKVAEYLKNYQENEKAGRWLVMAGNYGTGKTHLSIAILKKVCSIYAKQAIDSRPDLPVEITRKKIISNPVLFVKTPELLEEIRSTYDRNDINEDDVLFKYKTRRFLVLDDLGVEKPSDSTREKLYSILDYRYSNMRPTVITTNCDMNELVNRIGERIVDRIQEVADGYITIWQGDSHRLKGDEE